RTPCSALFWSLMLPHFLRRVEKYRGAWRGADYFSSEQSIRRQPLSSSQTESGTRLQATAAEQHGGSSRRVPIPSGVARFPIPGVATAPTTRSAFPKRFATFA